MGTVTGHVKRVERHRGPQFYVKYRGPDGRQVQKLLGPAWTERGRPPTGYFTAKTAEQALQAILADARRGTLAGAVRTGASFADAAAEWLRYVEHDRKRQVSTVVGYRSALSAHLLPEFGHLALERVTPQVIDAYRRRLVQDERLSARTINKLLVQLHAIFARAQRLHGLDANPVAGVDRQPMERSGDFRVLAPNEVELLTGAAESAQDAALYTVAAFTGLRMGELRALRWSDVDFSKRLVHVRRSYTSHTLGVPKSGKVRSVPLIDQAARALDALSRREHFVERDDLVFCSEVGGHVDESALRRRFYGALDRAGLERLRFHDLRHSFGTLAVQVFPLSDVKAYMGHARIETTMIYVHHVPRHDAADRLSALVSADVSPLVSRTAENPAQLSATERR